MTRTPLQAAEAALGSEGERALETSLRRRGIAYVREYPFAAPARKWRFDFAFMDRLVACEVEGGTFVGGRHNRGQAFENDCIKYAEAAIRGWRVLRVTTDMVTDGRALLLIERALR